MMMEGKKGDHMGLFPGATGLGMCSASRVFSGATWKPSLQDWTQKPRLGGKMETLWLLMLYLLPWLKLV